jgi:hypothetical protein
MAAPPSSLDLDLDLHPALSEVRPTARRHAAAVPMDLAADLISTLNEWIGHMGADVGTAGYEYDLVRRTRSLAQRVQASIIAAAVEDADCPTLGGEGGGW